MDKVAEIINILKTEGKPESIIGMAKFGINTEKAFGVSMPFIRNLADNYNNDHDLAVKLWTSGFHEARILSAIIDDNRLVTTEQMENWVMDFNSWDLCDQCCSNLFVFTPFAYNKAIEWAGREEEFVKRAGFVMMACIAVKLKEMKDESFGIFFDLILMHSYDDRKMVKKAVNWALRQIGKRNLILNVNSIQLSEKLMKSKDKAALWIAKDAYRELTSNAIKRKMKKL